MRTIDITPVDPAAPLLIEGGWYEIYDRDRRWLGLVATWPEVILCADRRGPGTRLFVVERLRRLNYARPAGRWRVIVKKNGTVMSVLLPWEQKGGSP